MLPLEFNKSEAKFATSKSANYPSYKEALQIIMSSVEEENEDSNEYTREKRVYSIALDPYSTRNTLISAIH